MPVWADNMGFMTADFSWPETLTQLLERRDLSVAQASSAMEAVMAGDVTDAQMAAFLVRPARGQSETVDEIVGFRDAVLKHAVAPYRPDGSRHRRLEGDPYGAVVNVSSIASIVASAAGVPVVKHGNRAAKLQPLAQVTFWVPSGSI